MEISSCVFLLLPLVLQLFATVLCEVCPAPEDIAPCKCVYVAPIVIEIRCQNVSMQEVSSAFDNLNRKRVTNVILSGVVADSLPSLLFWDVCVINLWIHNCDLKRLSDNDRSPPLLGLEKCLRSFTVYKSIKGANQLNTLDLSRLVELHYLSLSGNNIPVMGNDWFQNAPRNLETIKVENCGLTQLGGRTFANLDNLERLTVTGNRQIEFKRSMIRDPTFNLAFLDLAHNNITSLPEDMFTNMRPLNMVFLSGNAISHLEEKTWSPVWEKLNVLDVEDNPLECDSHMEWMFSLKPANRIYGTCGSPEPQKGERLLHFIERKRS